MLNVGLKYGVFVKYSVFLFSLLIIFFMDNSSLRIVDWQISNSCNILVTLYAISFTGEVVAFVSQYPKSPRGSVILFGVLLYTYSEMISEFVFFTYFIDEIVILKNL